MASADDELAARLRALKAQAPADAATDAELAARLHAIQPGRPLISTGTSTRPAPLAPPKRSDSEEVNDLLSMATDCVRLAGGTVQPQPSSSDADADVPAGDIAAALDDARCMARGAAAPGKAAIRDMTREAKAALREAGAARTDHGTSGHVAPPELEDEDAIAAEAEELLRDLIEEEEAPSAQPKAAAAAGFPAAPTTVRAPVAPSFPSAPTTAVKPPRPQPVERAPSAESDDDDPSMWCCICHGDAVLRCADCDDDPLCRRCFREGHRELDLRDHRAVPIKRQPKRR